MPTDELVRNARAYRRIGEVRPVDDIPRSVRFVRERHQLAGREPAVGIELANDDLTMLLGNIVERHRNPLPGRIVQKFSRPCDRAFLMDFECVEHRLDHWSVLPRFEVISNQALGHLPERTRLNEEQQLVDAQICKVELDRVEIRQKEIAYLASFIHGDPLTESSPCLYTRVGPSFSLAKTCWPRPSRINDHLKLPLEQIENKRLQQAAEGFWSLRSEMPNREGAIPFVIQILADQTAVTVMRESFRA